MSEENNIAHELMTLYGKENIVLKESDYLSHGGQGTIYKVGDKIYKIFNSPEHILSKEKFKELLPLREYTNITVPEDLLFRNNNIVGYVTKFLSDGIPLSRLFSVKYRQKNNWSNLDVLKLIENMRRTIEFIHSKNVVVVDGNELNYMVSKKDKSLPYFIDVDSWKTPNCKPTALMPSIKDPHADKISVDTDWYAFAIVTFQLLAGIHPYKGKHEIITGLQSRMKHNLSVFNTGVKLPPSIKMFNSLMLKPMEQWYKATFEKGFRGKPPEINVKGNKVIVSSSSYDKFNYEIEFGSIDLSKVLINENMSITSFVGTDGNITEITTMDSGYYINGNYRPRLCSGEDCVMNSDGSVEIIRPIKKHGLKTLSGKFIPGDLVHVIEGNILSLDSSKNIIYKIDLLRGNHINIENIHECNRVSMFDTCYTDIEDNSPDGKNKLYLYSFHDEPWDITDFVNGNLIDVKKFKNIAIILSYDESRDTYYKKVITKDSEGLKGRNIYVSNFNYVSAAEKDGLIYHLTSLNEIEVMDPSTLKIVKFLTTTSDDGELFSVTKDGIYSKGLYLKTAKNTYKIVKENLK